MQAVWGELCKARGEAVKRTVVLIGLFAGIFFVPGLIAGHYLTRQEMLYGINHLEVELFVPHNGSSPSRYAPIGWPSEDGNGVICLYGVELDENPWWTVSFGLYPRGSLSHDLNHPLEVKTVQVTPGETVCELWGRRYQILHVISKYRIHDVGEKREYFVILREIP